MSSAAQRRFERLIGRTSSGIPLKDFSAEITDAGNSETICTVEYDFKNQTQIVTEIPSVSLNTKTLSNNND